MNTLTRDPNSHKGENGKVLIIGGNERFHGAPILAAKGAEAAGVDLIFMAIPPCQTEVTKNAGLNFIVQSFEANHLTQKDLPHLLKTSQEADVTVIGNGLGKEDETRKALVEFLRAVEGVVVIDADGLIEDLLRIRRPYAWVLTPHDEEFRRVFKEDPTKENISAAAQERQCVIIKKGPVDLISNTAGDITENKTGCPQMTVGGTGDALAGLIAGLIAQGLTPFEAAQQATKKWGDLGEELAQEQNRFTCEELLQTYK